MTRKDEIKNELQRKQILDVLREHRNVDDLKIILDIKLENKDYYSIESILSAFPKTIEYDSLKVAVLNRINAKLDASLISSIIENLYNDQTKLEQFEKYYKRFDDTYYKTNIFCSLHDDNLRKEKFREYIDFLNSEEFSDYLRNIKDDNLRESEFLLFKDKFPTYLLPWYANSFATDEKRIEVFNKYYDESRKEDIPYFISLLKSDKSKVSCLDYYNDSIKKSDMWWITDSLNEQDKIIDVIRRYKEKVPGYELATLLSKIDDELLKYKLLEEVYQYMHPSLITDIIIKIKNYDKKVELFDKYIECFNLDNLRTMLIYIDDDKKENFLDKYIENYLPILANIWKETTKYHRFRGLNGDTLLNKYIDLLDIESLSVIMTSLMEKYDDYSSVLMYLLLKTSNRNTAKNIFTALKSIEDIIDIESNEKTR